MTSVDSIGRAPPDPASEAIDLSLTGILRLLEALGHPQRRLPPVIHVPHQWQGLDHRVLRACWKRRTCACTSYIAPHLVRFNERFRLGRSGGGVLVRMMSLLRR